MDTPSPSEHARNLRLPHGTPIARNRQGNAAFFVSGNSCRRHCLVHSGATRASPSPLSSPEVLSSSREQIPLLNLVREPSPPQNHFATEASSAAKLAAGSSLRPHLPDDRREDRPGVADPSPPSGPRKEPPVAGDDRRTPRLGTGQRKRREKTSQT